VCSRCAIGRRREDIHAGQFKPRSSGTVFTHEGGSSRAAAEPYRLATHRIAFDGSGLRPRAALPDSLDGSIHLPRRAVQAAQRRNRLASPRNASQGIASCSTAPAFGLEPPYPIRSTVRFTCHAGGSSRAAAEPPRMQQRPGRISDLRFRSVPRMRPGRAVLPDPRRDCPA
jgi:hypothetical protein